MIKIVGDYLGNNYPANLLIMIMQGVSICIASLKNHFLKKSLA